MKLKENAILVKFTTGQTRTGQTLDATGKLSGGTMTGGREFKFDVARDVWLDLAAKTFDRIREEQSGADYDEGEAEGGEVSAFLHSYGLKPDKLKEGQVCPFNRATREGFDHPAKELWLTATKRAPRTLSPEEKKARAAKSLTTRQADWDKRNAVLAPMLATGKLTQEEYDLAIGSKRPA